MMTGDTTNIEDSAARWHLASTCEDMDWEGFTVWLEADPRHRRAFDEIALSDELAVKCAPELAVEQFNLAEDIGTGAAHRRWPVWAGGALAATIAAFAIVPRISGPTPTIYTAGSSARTIALADGSQVILAPSSRLTVDEPSAHHLALAGGALFDIRHDPARSLTIRAGGIEVTDIGTVFDIQATANAVRVEVSDGAVNIAGEALAGPVRLTAGKRFEFDSGRAVATVEPVSVSDVGAWHEARLTFDTAPLTLVVEDLVRYTGVKIELSPGLADRRFSGTLSIGDGDAAIRDVAQIMGLRLVRNGDTARLEP